MSHRRNGKVAQLPRAVRDQVNAFIDDGKTYPEIIAWLEANGHPGIITQNLSQWRKGGFQDWLRHQEKLSHMANLRELCADIASQNDRCKTQEATIHVAAAGLCQAFLKFDPAKLAKTLDRKPERFTTLLNAFTRLNRRSNELDLLKEYLHQEEERRRKELEKQTKGPEELGLSDEAGDLMERRLKLA